MAVAAVRGELNGEGLLTALVDLRDVVYDYVGLLGDNPKTVARVLRAKAAGEATDADQA